MKYRYPQVKGGYRWNMLQRICNSIGFEPVGSGDFALGDEWITELMFERELTEEEKQKVDTIMADDPTFPPKDTGTSFVIKDVWNKKKEIGEKIGIPYDLYYTEEIVGSGDVNQVELHFKGVLTDEQVAKVIEEYGKLISRK